MQRFKEMRNRRLVAAWGAFFIWMLVGVMWSENTAQAWNDIGIAYPLLGIPLLLSLSPRLDQQDLDKVMWAMTIGGIAAMGTAAVGGWHVFETYGKADYFFYHNLVWLLDMPSASYLSFYLVMPAVLLFFYVLRHWRETHKTISFSLLVVLAVLLLGQFFLSVRVILMTLLFLVPVILILVLRNSMRKRRLLITVAGCLLVATVLIVTIPQLSSRFSQFLAPNLSLAFKADYQNSDVGLNEVNYRLMLWRFSLESLQGNWLGGIGTGDWPDALRERMMAANVNDAAWGMNAHNQFLQILLTLGTIGLVLLLIPLLMTMHSAWQQRNFACLVCVLVFIVCFLTECILLRMHGVLLFSTVMGVVAFASSDTTTSVKS